MILNNSYDDKASQAIALETIQDFSRISLQNADVVGKSDATRRRELEQEGKHIGQGLVHVSNESCSDSLLQLLSRKLVWSGCRVLLGGERASQVRGQ